jgi:tape measure domain-containing protein
VAFSPFSSYNAEGRVTIVTTLLGEQKVVEGTNAMTAAMERLGITTTEAGLAAKRSSFMYNQMQFTARRYLFYTTLAITGMVVALFRLGLSYDNAINKATVAMKGFLPTTQAVNKEVQYLYRQAAFSPFMFQDIATAARRILPFVDNVNQANTAVFDLSTSLAAAGLTGAANLNRATIAMQHLFSIGRVTGLTLLQMSRDNIPLTQALAKYYGTTTMSIREMVRRGIIPATVAAKALDQYVRTQPGYKGALARLQLGTLTGVWTTFKDILAQSMGQSSAGLFGFAVKTLRNIDLALEPMFLANKPIRLIQVAEAINNVLTPQTNAFLNAYTLLEAMIKQVAWNFQQLAKAVNLVFTIFNKLTGAFGNNTKASGILGRALGLLITFMIVKRLSIFLFMETVSILVTVFNSLRGSILLLIRIFPAFLQLLRMAYWAVATLAEAVGVLDLVTLGWIGLVVLVVAGLVVLYFKWKWFHNVVNDTFRLIKSNWKTIQQNLMAAFGPIFAVAEIIGLVAKGIGAITGHRGGGRGSGGGQPAQHKRSLGGIGGSGITGGKLLKLFLGIPGFSSFQHGGVVPMFGSTALVGERGPELLNLPGGARVSPLSSSTGAIGSGSLNITVMPQAIYFNSRQIGQVMADVVTDKEARR